MPGTTFDIPFLYQATFGYRPVVFDQVPEREQQSLTGAPLYGKANGIEYFMPATLGGVELPFPIIRVSGRKTIVETPLVARRGTVKELIALEDYRILVRGIIIEPSGRWPEKYITELRQLYERNEALSLDCALTNIFLGGVESGGSDKVVITSLDFPETRGAKNVTGYQLELVGDQPFVLEIK